MVDLRLGLEESGADGRTWIGDHQLRMERWRPGREGRVPDGLFEYGPPGTVRLGILEYEHAPYRKPQALDMLFGLRALYPDRRLFVVTRTAERARFFRAWAAESTAYADAPALAVFSHAEAVVKAGLNAPFVDLRDRPWSPQDKETP